MLHDVIITIGVYSLTGREVTASTVAAVLTVLGVLDLRHHHHLRPRAREHAADAAAPFAQIANVSLWETIRRSLATTLITVLPVVSLYFFGGATLKDFAFALMVGIISGAYSSIFIAAPLLATWKEREPEFARRVAAGPDDPDGGRRRSVARSSRGRAPRRSTPTRSHCRSRRPRSPRSRTRACSTCRRARPRRKPRPSATRGGSGAARSRMAAPTDERSAVARPRRAARPGRARRGRTDGRAGRRAGRRAVRSRRVRRDEARELIMELSSRWRGDALRVGERAGAGLGGMLRELGLVTRQEYEELELRARAARAPAAPRRRRARAPVALTRRVKLLERAPALWGRRRASVWHFMRFVVAPPTLWLAPSYGYGAERIPARRRPARGQPLLGDRPSAALLLHTAADYFMAKAELFEIPVFGEMLRVDGDVPDPPRRGRPRRAALGAQDPARRRDRRRPRRGHAAEVRAPGPVQLGGAVDREHGGRAGDPVRARHVRLDAAEPEAVLGRLRRADLARRDPPRPGRLRGGGGDRRRRARAPVAARGGRLRDGFPPELPGRGAAHRPGPAGGRRRR